MNKAPRANKQTTRRQHYVWRHYLEAWEFKDGLTNCLREGRIFTSNPVNIMVERDFYKLSSITRMEVEFLELFLKKTPAKDLRDLNRSLVQNLSSIVRLNEVIQRGGNFSTTEKQTAEGAVIETEEQLHTQTEGQASEMLTDLRRKRVEFLNDQPRAITFFHFLAHQYVRTKRMRETFRDVLSTKDNGHDFSNLTNLWAYCVANNMGASLYYDRNYFEVVFLDATASFEFVTGDQPIVNLMGTRDGTPPKEVAFYYPLGPELAMILLPTMYKLRATDTSLLLGLNDAVAWESRQFLVAKTADTLQRYGRADRASLVPPTWSDFVE